MVESQTSGAAEDETGIEREISSLISSATLVFVGGIVSSASKLVERVVIGRMLSPELYGEVSMALAILSLCSTLAMAGFSQGIPRYLSRMETPRDRRGVLIGGLVVAGGLSLLIALLFVVLSDEITGWFFETPAATDLLRLFALTLPLLVGFKIAMAGVRGHENTIYKTYVGDLLYPIGRVVLLWALLALGYGIYAIGYAYLCFAGIALVAAYYLLNRLLTLFGSVEPHVVDVARFSAPLVVSTLLSALLTRTDTMMVGYFKPSTAVGVYNAAYPLANGLTIVLASFGFLFLPLISRLDANGRDEEISTIYALTTKWIFILTFPAFLLFAVFPSDALSVFFGREYARGGLALSILTFGFFTNAIAGRTRETISALGATKIILLANSTAFLLNVALNLVLIPRFSYVGAATASAVSMFVLNVGLYLTLWLKFDVRPFSRWSRNTFLALPAVLLLPAVMLSTTITITTVLVPVFLVGSGLACLCIVVLANCVQPEDEILIRELESAVGRPIPWVRRFVPDGDEE